MAAVDGGTSAQNLGRTAEELVWRYLRQRGFKLVAKNLRLGHLELDLVVRKNELIAIVEVRTRSLSSKTTAFGSIDGRKRQRLRVAAARLWKKRYRHDPSVQRIRFDVAQVSFDAPHPRIEYVPAAFQGTP